MARIFVPRFIGPFRVPDFFRSGLWSGKIFQKIEPTFDQSSISEHFSNPDQFLAGPKRLNSARGLIRSGIRSGFSKH